MTYSFSIKKKGRYSTLRYTGTDFTCPLSTTVRICLPKTYNKLIKSNMQIQKAKELVALAEKNCYISNSIKSKVEVIPEIKVGNLNG